MMYRLRYIFALASAAVVVVTLSSVANADNVSVRPVRIIVPCPVGSLSDLSIRAVAKWWSENKGRRYYIENWPDRLTSVGVGTRAASDEDSMLFDLGDCNSEPGND